MSKHIPRIIRKSLVPTSRIIRAIPGKTTMSELEIYANKHPNALVCYSINSCWWCLLSENSYGLVLGENDRWPLPCDPSGSPLFQAPIGDFLKTAKENIAHYGKHGLGAFIAAYNGNIVDNAGRPVAWKGWDKYNDYVDAVIAKAKGEE